MKYLVALLLLLIAYPKISSAQKIEFINSGEVIKQAIALNDSGNYKQALLLYNKISRSDTNYVRATYEKAYTCEADSQFSQALKYCQEGLALKEGREYEPDLYTLYGDCLSDMGKNEEALKVYDMAIVKYPAYGLLYFNKGISLLALNRYHDAELLFQKTLMINPYIYSAHYQLAVTALKQGKIIPAFLSAMGYLLVNPQGKYWSKSINLLNGISRSTDEMLDYKNKRTITPDANYQAMEDIVFSKIALEKEYKPIIALDDAISRQMQAVCEKLEYKDADKDFWIQYYLPYYKHVYNDGKFEPFVNHLFSNVNIPVIQDYKKKNKKLVDGLIDDASDYFNLLRETRELNYKNRDTVSKKFYYESGKLVGRGVLTNKGKTLTGAWEFYYTGGNLKGKGIYNDAGGREGDWKFYFTTGQLKSREHYISGKLQGGQDYYFENGNPSSHENYANDSLDGLITTYYYAGNKRSVSTYKLGKKDGEVKEYYSNGNLELVHVYANGVLTGTAREYFKSGQLKVTEEYSNGKHEGAYKLYHENGNLSVEGQNVKDNGQGEWKYYYDDGKLKEKRTYVNDTEEGPHEEYFESGKTISSYNVKKGKINGEAAFYYEDGKVLAKYVYDNGDVKSAQYFNGSGAQISSSVTKNNQMDLVTYATDGNKRSHFTYNPKGVLEGPDTLFYPSGRINQINQYKNGELNGPSISYHLNGNKKAEMTLTDGKTDGYYINYYTNGKPESEGWIKDGEDQGEWDFYDESGKLTSKSYYLDDDINGYKEEFLPNGQKTTEQKYHHGWLQTLTQYDSAGKVIAVDSFPKESGKYTLVYPNGKTMAEGNYVNGDFDGPYKTYFFDGSPETSSFYKKGLRDSMYVGFYYGGVKYTEGRYKAGNKTGTWKAYEENGKLSSTTTYANDMMNGERVYYFPNGNKDFVSQYKDDQLDGTAIKYDPDGTLAYQTTFEGGDIKSYSYPGKDGRLLPAIPVAVKNGVMKSYFQNGKPSRECYYSDGLKNGRDILYYSNGQVRSVDTTVYGITEGVSREYTTDGKLKSEYHYLTDNANGICREFNDKGVLRKEITFENGLNNGPIKYYDEDGKPGKTLWYIYGTLVSAKNEK